MKRTFPFIGAGVLTGGLLLIIAGCTPTESNHDAKAAQPVQVSFPLERTVTDYPT